MSTINHGTLIAVVQYGDEADDIGAVFNEDGYLVALWPDGGADVVTRDAHGRLWDEYGETVYKIGAVEHTGTRLRVVSRSKRRGWEIAAKWDAKMAADNAEMDALEASDG